MTAGTGSITQTYNPVGTTGTANALSITSTFGIDTTGIGRVAIGTSTPVGGRLAIQGNTEASGAAAAVAGIYEILTLQPSAGGTQVGNRYITINKPGSANTGIGTLARVVDNTSLGSTIRVIEVQADAGGNTSGVSSGIRGSGHTFGVQAFTTGLAGSSLSPAAVFADTDGTTQGEAFRGYTDTLTTSDFMELFQETSTFTGIGLKLNFGAGTGSFGSGAGDTSTKFLSLQVNGNVRFDVATSGQVTVGNGTAVANLRVPFGGICADNDGSCLVSTSSPGMISATGFFTGSTDLAEAYTSQELLEEGEIVFTKGKYEIAKASTTTQPIIGI
ncbi:MAG: hypothetical protein AAB737_03070, partial [Patescibacteria group bacterium]